MESAEYLQSLYSSLFWDVDRESVDTEKNQRFLICRVMDRGTREDVTKTMDFYTEPVVLKNLQQARTLEPKTLHYLDEELKKFSLVRGTALTLYFGHRRSVDIDLFKQSSFDAPALAEYLKQTFALKGNAIANRGAKQDFWDIHRLLKVFSLEELLGFCGQKYQADSLWNVEKSLLYFEDADGDPDPVDFQGLSWEQIKQDLKGVVK